MLGYRGWKFASGPFAELLLYCLSGILAGLVSITAGCAVVEPHGACFIGAVGGLIYYASAQLLLKLRIDDPLEASSVHFFSGMWGVVSVGMFATKSGIEMAYTRE